MKKLYSLTTRQANVIAAPYILPKRSRDMIYITNCFTVKNNPDIEALKKAFNNLLKTQDSLRTIIVFTMRGLKQYVEEYKYVDIPVIELSSKNELDKAIYENKTLGSVLNTPLYKAIIFKYDNAATLMMVFNHVIYDGYSVGISLKQITNDYKAYASGDKPNEEVVYSIEEYYKDDYKYRKSKKYKEDVRYWKNALNNRKDYRIIIPVFKMTKVNKKTFEISGDDYKKAHELCKDLNISLTSLLTSVVAITLGKYLNKNDFAFTQTSYGRNFVQKQSIGCYVGVFLSFYHLNSCDSVEKFLKDSYASYLQSMQHMNTSAAKIVFACLKKELQIMRFNSWGLMFSVLDNIDLEYSDEYEYSFIDHRYQPNQFYCSICDNKCDKICLNLLYQTKLVEDKVIDEIIEKYKKNLNLVVNNKELLIEDVE